MTHKANLRANTKPQRWQHTLTNTRKLGQVQSMDPSTMPPLVTDTAHTAVSWLGTDPLLQNATSDFQQSS
jgi:hypothetical protein